MKKRTVTVKRKTRETDISVKLGIDGSGRADIKTGIAFLDHMLNLFAFHGLFDLDMKVKGQDLDVGIHHTNEDVGIVLGDAFRKALGSKGGIRRFGEAFAPMDEALVRAVVDISGRPSLNFNYKKWLGAGKAEAYSIKDAGHFLGAFTTSSGITLNIGIESGNDMHHIIEALFKALAIAMDAATQLDPRKKGVPSTKGRL